MHQSKTFRKVKDHIRCHTGRENLVALVSYFVVVPVLSEAVETCLDDFGPQPMKEISVRLSVTQ